MFLVICQNYKDNKISSHNFIDYFYKVSFLILSEIVFDWIKNIIIFKISDFKANTIKISTIELTIFHEKLKYNCFYTNGGSEHLEISDYLKKLENYKMTSVNENKLQRYSRYLNNDNIMSIELQNNILVQCIIVK